MCDISAESYPQSARKVRHGAIDADNEWMSALASSVPGLIAVAVALVVFGVASVALTVIDIRTHRLPTPIVLSTGAGGVVLLSIAAWADAEPGRLVRALLAGATLFAAFFVLALMRAGALGGGDVKLAAVLGMNLGWFGWESVIVGVCAGFLLGGLTALVLLATRRANRHTRIAFGPFLLGGAWLAVCDAVL